MTDFHEIVVTELNDLIAIVLELIVEFFWDTGTGGGLLPDLWNIFYTAITGGVLLYAFFVICFAGGTAAAIKKKFG